MLPILAFIFEILESRIFWTLTFTYIITHFVKLLTHRYESGRWSAGPLWETGGMPSSHSSIVVALSVAIGLETGVSAVFFLSVIFALIVIRDSFGVRASVGEQARILNVLSSKLNIHEKARTVLGHTPAQVTIGALLGFVVASGIYLLP